MADKKVERSRRERPLTPTQKMEAALSDPGTMNVAETTRDRAKSGLVDKFREREARWRREQALHDQQEAHATERSKPEEEPAGPAETVDSLPRTQEAKKSPDRGEGGGS